MDTSEPEIPKFYASKKVLITGATGFIGKILVWKLLRSCPEIDTIYVLVRPKHGKNTSSRKDELLNFMIFDILKKENPKILEKVTIISGDVSEASLGLSETDKRKIIDDVSIVFHGAAMLKMDADLKKAVNVNTEGTLRLLELCRQMKRLKTFIYISTAYCCCDVKIIKEKIYPTNESPRDVIDLVRWMEPNVLEALTPSLLKQLPNTYTYTKRLAEGLLEEFSSEFPIVIARPTIVIPCLKEPIPGWVDNLNGPLGLSIAVAKGVMRVVNCDPDKSADMIPADIVANGLIVAAWARSKQQNVKRIQVCHLALTETDPITWREIHNRGIRSCEKYPFEKMLWYPSNDCFYQNETVFRILSIFLHWLPAYFIDFMMLLLGQKTLYAIEYNWFVNFYTNEYIIILCSMVRIQNKIYQGQKVLSYFAKREWKIQTDGILQIKTMMNTADREIFPITMKNLSDREEYMDNIIYMARKVLMKDDPNTIPECKKKLKRMYYLHCIAKTIIFLLVAKYCIKVLIAVLD